MIPRACIHDIVSRLWCERGLQLYSTAMLGFEDRSNEWDLGAFSRRRVDDALFTDFTGCRLIHRRTSV